MGSNTILSVSMTSAAAKPASTARAIISSFVMLECLLLLIIVPAGLGFVKQGKSAKTGEIPWASLKNMGVDIWKGSCYIERNEKKNAGGEFQ